MSSAKVQRTGLPSAVDAARSMPFDSRPRIFRGARLVTTTTLRPTRFFGRVGQRDSGEDLADFVADIDHKFQQLVRALDSFGGFDARRRAARLSRNRRS